MAALSEILEPRFVERFLIEENNSYEDLVKEIKNQFPGVRGCSLRSVKRFCSPAARNQESSVSVRQYARSCRAIRVFSSPGHRSTKIEFVKTFKFSFFFLKIEK